MGRSPQASEAARGESRPLFQVRTERNLVVVRAVVRGRDGSVVRGLATENFRIFDNGKPQAIIDFSVETGGAQAPAPRVSQGGGTKPHALPERLKAPAVAQRYVALFFDDLHLYFPEAAKVRDAALRYLRSSREPGDRAAIVTASGEVEQDFTDSRAALAAALARIQPRGRTQRDPNACPDIGEYQAYLISVRQDRDALEVAMKEALLCGRAGDPGAVECLTPDVTLGSRRCGQWGAELASAAALVRSVAGEVWGAEENQARTSIESLGALVGRMAAAPGHGSVVLVSSGFLALTQMTALDEIIDRALRSNITLSSIDARGLYPELAGRVGTQLDPMSAAGRNLRPGQDDGELRLKQAMEHQGTLMKADVLSELAEATGGTFFHNSNDMDEGFRSGGELPEVYYTLTFSPSNLKPGGRFHALKVELTTGAPYVIQARRGYFAPERNQKTMPVKDEGVTSAIFAQDEIHGLPVEFRAEAAKSDKGETVVLVSIHIDIARLRFRKEDGLSLNKLTLRTAVFDRDGKYVAGNERTIDIRVKDDALAKLSREGFTGRTKLSVPPGSYRVREVVSDSVAGGMTAASQSVEVRF